MGYILKGATCYIDGNFTQMDVAVEGERITSVAQSIEASSRDEVIDVEGMILMPAFVDVHLHLREPGMSYKETIATGTAAAAKGGYSTVVSMPNLSPAPDSLDNLAVQQELIEKSAVIEVIPSGSITLGQKGEGTLVDFEALAPHVAGFSDDGRGVQRGELMQQAMLKAKECGKPIIAHCEDESLLGGGYIHDGEYCKANGHKGICSKSEWGQLERDLELVKLTGAQYHMCHLSTKESVELIRKAKAEGLKVSCETAPHYLLLTDSDLEESGRFKMNPPLRSYEDQLAIIEGVIDGTIDVIATDHAPHSFEEKSLGLAKSAFGIVGIETAFPLLYTYLVRRGVMTLERLAEMMCSTPRKIFNFESVTISEGSRADIVVVDPERLYTIDPAEFVSMGEATPFEGWEVKGGIHLTMVKGDIKYINKN